MKMRIVPIILIIIALVAAVVVLRRSAQAPVVEQPIATVSYLCNAGKTIDASYYRGTPAPTPAPGEPPTPSGSVAIALSDGRSMTLPQTLSADGARYANTDESFVFWSKGNGALVLEGGQEKSYIGCILVANEPVGRALPQAYVDSGMGFSLRLPSGYVADSSYRYQELGPGKDIAGIKFTISLATAAGTNLGADTYLSVEEIPQTQDCTAALFLDHATPRTITDGDTTYSVASSTGAGAGNRYEETVYALPGTNPCIAVRYFIHYGVFENYPAGAVRAFDRQAILAEFDAIRRTLRVP